MTTDGAQKRRVGDAKKDGSRTGGASILSSMLLSNQSNRQQPTRPSAKDGVGAESQYSSSYDQHLLSRILARQGARQGQRGMRRQQPKLAVSAVVDELP